MEHMFATPAKICAAIAKAFFIFSFGAIIGCYQVTDQYEYVGAVESKIHNGKITSSIYSQLTVQIVSNKNSYCSGVIIEKDLIATAYHCIAPLKAQAVNCSNSDPDFFEDDYDPKNIYIYLGTNPRFDVEPYAKTVKIFHNPSKKICSNDVAILLISKPIDVVPLKIRSSNKIDSDETFSVVGYGINNVGQLGYFKEPYGVKLEMNEALLGGVFGKEFVLTGKVKGGNVGGGCSGDSGGPAFSEKTQELIGVFSRGGSCDAESSKVYSFLGQHEDLLLAAYKESKFNEQKFSDRQKGNINEVNSEKIIASSCSLSSKNESTILPLFFVFLVVVGLFRKLGLI
jgi:hypothetical protein